jgi:D-glutamate N-acetyltransferase
MHCWSDDDVRDASSLLTGDRVAPYTPRMRPDGPRRLIILAEGAFGPHDGKTAYGVIRYGRDEVVAVLDSTKAGENVESYLPGHDIPIVASLGDALALSRDPDALLIGIAPTGGRLPAAWRAVILEAIAADLDVLSGLHTLIGDDPEFSQAARLHGTALIDYRRPPDRLETAIGRRHGSGKRVILTVGTDCAIGKMSVALDLRRAAVAAGDRATFVATGQTGIMIEGWGVAVDRLISDFAQGVVESLVAEGEQQGDWVLLEGQGSLDHPAYSSVTLSLIHGATPHAMVMVHKPGSFEHDFDHLPEASFPIAPLPSFIALHEQVAGLVAPSKVVAVALNTSLYPEDRAARRVIDEIAAETGLPTDDPFRFGADRLWAAIRAGVEALPWVDPS